MLLGVLVQDGHHLAANAGDGVLAGVVFVRLQVLLLALQRALIALPFFREPLHFRLTESRLSGLQPALDILNLLLNLLQLGIARSKLRLQLGGGLLAFGGVGDSRLDVDDAHLVGRAGRGRVSRLRPRAGHHEQRSYNRNHQSDLHSDSLFKSCGELPRNFPPARSAGARSPHGLTQHAKRFAENSRREMRDYSGGSRTWSIGFARRPNPQSQRYRCRDRPGRFVPFGDHRGRGTSNRRLLSGSTTAARLNFGSMATAFGPSTVAEFCEPPSASTERTCIPVHEGAPELGGQT